MKMSKKQADEIKNNMSEEEMYFCNNCKEYFIIRSTDPRVIDGDTCPCCGIRSCEIEYVHIIDGE